MFQTTSKTVLALGLAALLPACLGVSADTTSAGANSGNNVGPGFDGVDSASAISNTKALISWPDAVGATQSSSASMKYRVYRSLELDLAGELLGGGVFIGETPPGVTSLVDTDLNAFQTAYYRVEAVDTEGRVTSNNKVTSARTPSEFAAGVASYTNDVAPLWLTEDVLANGTNCLTCHSTGDDLDLSTYQGLMIGTGTQQDPDSFIVPYDGDATWAEFIFRFVNQPLVHGNYYGVAGSIQAMRQPLSDWVAEGAIEIDDETPPVFEFSLIQNAGKYFGDWVDHDTIEVTFFHASDPESTPLSGDTTGQLEYHVYAGKTSGTIDWLNPIATTSSNNAQVNSTMSVQFDWTEDRAVIVVRALDASGRAVIVPDPSDPGYLEALALRWRNMSLNEEEIKLKR